MNPTELPSKPSALIRLGLRDLQLVAQTPGYLIEMGSWHDPGSDGVCKVCLAGAVMVMTFGTLPDEDDRPGLYPEDTSDALLALDNLRQGYVNIAFRCLGLNSEIGRKFNRRITDYAVNSVQFIHDMEQLAADLAAEGY